MLRKERFGSGMLYNLVANCQPLFLVAPSNRLTAESTASETTLISSLATTILSLAALRFAFASW